MQKNFWGGGTRPSAPHYEILHPLLGCTFCQSWRRVVFLRPVTLPTYFRSAFFRIIDILTLSWNLGHGDCNTSTTKLYLYRRMLGAIWPCPHGGFHKGLTPIMCLNCGTGMNVQWSKHHSHRTKSHHFEYSGPNPHDSTPNWEGYLFPHCSPYMPATSGSDDVEYRYFLSLLLSFLYIRSLRVFSHTKYTDAVL